MQISLLTDAPLLLQATEALLAGWCGPVVWDGEEAMLFDDGYLVQRDGGKPYPAGYPELPDLRLDLARATVRDRVARVVFGTPSLPRCWRAHSAGYAKGVAFQMGRGEGGVWYEGGDWWDGGQGHSPKRFCPALAALDPHDDTRLPDGSSRVDALALLAVAREVLGE